VLLFTGGYAKNKRMGKYKRKTERKHVFKRKDMEKAKRRVASGESLRRVAASLRIKAHVLRERLKAVSTCKNPVLFVRF
jgi:hypothetical protein